MKSIVNIAVMSLMFTLLIAGSAFSADVARADSDGQMTKAALFQGAIPADKVVGMTVQNRGGQDIGKVTAQTLDENGKTSFLTISTGGFLGIGAKEHLVPVDVFKPTQNNDALVLTVDEQLLANAPQKTSEMNEKGFERKLVEHYGQAPSWGKEDNQTKPFDPGPQDSY